MTGAYLPGNSTVELRDAPVPEPGHGEVLLRMKASTICGSDIRCIYHEHLGKGPEGYQGVIAGHEPCGQIVKAGPGCKRFRAGDRVVIVYHISGCGVCDECQHGYMISCRSELPPAYGWQRDGGHAPILLAEEKAPASAFPIRFPTSTARFCACGFGTAYEALRRMQVSGQDRLLITGLGPVGLAAAMLGRALGATTIIGTDLSESRMALASNLKLVDVAIKADDSASSKIMERTGGHGCEVSIDCSVQRPPACWPFRARATGAVAPCGRRRDRQLRGLEVPDPQADHPLRLVGHLAEAPGGARRAARPLGHPSRSHLHAQAASLRGRQGVRAGRRRTDRKSLHRVRGLNVQVFTRQDAPAEVTDQEADPGRSYQESRGERS